MGNTESGNEKGRAYILISWLEGIALSGYRVGQYDHSGESAETSEARCDIKTMQLQDRYEDWERNTAGRGRARRQDASSQGSDNQGASNV